MSVGIDVRIWYSDKETARKMPSRQGMRMTPANWAVFQTILNTHSKELGFEQDADNNINHYLQDEVLDSCPNPLNIP